MALAFALGVGTQNSKNEWLEVFYQKPVYQPASSLIEAAKSNVLSIDDNLVDAVTVITKNGQLVYNLEASNRDFTSVVFYDIQGKKVLEAPVTSKTGSISTQSFTKGVYVATFIIDKQTSVSKKLIIK